MTAGGEIVSFSVQVFGTSGVKIDRKPITIMPKKAKWILMLLALASAEERSISRREISLLLWPWAEGDEYPVNRTMKSLRDALGERESSRIETSEPHLLHLNLSGAEVDAVTFRDLLKQAEAEQDPSPLEAHPEYRPSLLMMDFSEGKISIEPERARLRRKFLTALDKISNVSAERKAWEIVARSMKLAVDDNPLPDEGRTYRLMEAYQLLGDFESALDALTAFQEKGGKPSRVLLSLKNICLNQLRRQDTAVKESAPPPPYDVEIQQEPSSSEIIDAASPLQTELLRLINSASGKRSLRRFLEDHPQLLIGSTYVLSGYLLSDLKLGADFRVDFAFIEPRSGVTHLHLIALTDPRLRLFNDRDQFTSDFERAGQLLNDWSYWVYRNQSPLFSLFEPLCAESSEIQPGFLLPKCMLVIGRRSELSSVRRRERFQARCAKSEGSDTIQTYDGFLEEIEPILKVDPLNVRGIRCLTYRDRSFVERGHK